MAHSVTLKPNKSFRENARLLVPVLYDDFLARKDRVVAHPKLKKDLHAMRIAGKTLRYAMEVFEEGFGTEFSECLKEVKSLLELMGRVHDCDVNLPTLISHLDEMRAYNRVKSVDDRIATKSLLDLIRAQHQLRLSSYNEVSAAIQRWNESDFRSRMVQSMAAE